jgi:hypothetical protein
MLVGEIGVDMTRLPTAAHLRSWVRVCPRSDVSAGKHRSTRVQKGGAWIKPMLVGAAWAAVKVTGLLPLALAPPQSSARCQESYRSRRGFAPDHEVAALIAMLFLCITKITLPVPTWG